MKKIFTSISILLASLFTMTSFESFADESSVAKTCIPTVTISATPGTNICKGTEVTISSTVTNGGATPDYQWSVGGVAITNGTGKSDKITILPQLTGERYMLQVVFFQNVVKQNS